MRVLIDGLPPSFGDIDLAALFNRFGTVLSTEVAKNKDGHSLQFGFVSMGTSRDAHQAIRRLNGTMINDHLLLVMLADTQAPIYRSQFCAHSSPSSFA